MRASSFDVQKRYIEYLKRRYGYNFNFSFKYADLYHSYYNRDGRISPIRFKFPYENNSFDVVFLNSIFTHLLPEVVDHYLAETSRVLRPKGTLLASFFIGNSISKKYDRIGRTSAELLRGRKKLLNYRLKNCWVRDKYVKERIVIIDEQWIKKKTRKYFRIKEIIYGSWSGRKATNPITQQDFISAESIKR